MSPVDNSKHGTHRKIFGNKADARNGASNSVGYKTMTESAPAFTSYDGKLFEQELTRAAIERFATACSKLGPELHGEALSSSSKNKFNAYPNSTMTWSTFLQRIATIYEIDNTVFIVPSFAKDQRTITGIYPLVCSFAEVIQYGGEPFVKFHFATGDTKVIELEYVCIISKFQYSSEYFGEGNCLDQTMQLIHAQAQAQKNAIESGAKIRFIAAVEGQMREEDMKKKRERFTEDNFTSENTGGLLLYDNTFRDLQQITPQSYVIDSAEMERIKDNVYTYFGINEDILKNKYSEDTWGAWYEGRVEPFAVKLGDALTKLLFTPTQQAHGNRISFSSNKLEYASNASKRNMVRDMIDRGVMTINEGREVLQMPPVPGGDTFVIRGEYINASSVSNRVSVDGGGRMPKNDNEVDFDLGGDDQIYKESDAHGKDDFNAGS